MSVRGRSLSLSLTIVVALGVVVLSRAWGQALPSSAKVDTEPLDLTEPDRFAVPSVLEPVRRVTLMATADGVVRSQDARAGAAVREGQEIAQLDRGEAGARLKIAQAEVKEQQTFVDAAKEAEKAQGTGGQGAALQRAVVAAQARLDAAHARAELSQIAFDQCSLRAPFSGKVMASHVSDGQYVTKGTVIADLADVSSLRTLVPLTRAGASVGGSVTLSVEGQPVPGKIQSLLPLTEELAVLRELASPISAAWVLVPNTAGTLEPGQRVVSPALPVSPIATVPAHSFLKAEAKDKDAGSTVQVIRNEYVANVKVRVLGNLGPERVQVTGPLRATDALIVSTSVPLLPGTLIRFNSGTSGVVEPTSPNPAVSGTSANVTPPRAAAGAAPIGSPGSALPKPRPSSRPGANSADSPKTTKPSSKPGGPSVPF
jgi:RND family efflux transporter MFP subunit